MISLYTGMLKWLESSGFFDWLTRCPISSYPWISSTSKHAKERGGSSVSHMEDIIMSHSVVVLACCGSRGLMSLAWSCRVSIVVGGQMMGKAVNCWITTFSSPHCKCTRFADEKHWGAEIREGNFCTFFHLKQPWRKICRDSGALHSAMSTFRCN